MALPPRGLGPRAGIARALGLSSLGALLVVFGAVPAAFAQEPSPAGEGSSLGAEVTLGSPPEEVLDATAIFETPGEAPPSEDLGGSLEEHPELALDEVASDALAFRSPPVGLPKELPKDRRYVLPVDRSLISAADLWSPHHDYPAWDLGLPSGTPVVSVTAGTVGKTSYDGRCGIGVEILGTDGMTYLYCHGSGLTIQAGASVEAGDPIMLSGDTGHSTAPHLHLQIATGAGALVCPQAAIASWYAGGELSPATAGSSGCWYATPGDDLEGGEGPMGIGSGTGGGWFVPDGAEAVPPADSGAPTDPAPGPSDPSEQPTPATPDGGSDPDPEVPDPVPTEPQSSPEPDPEPTEPPPSPEPDPTEPAAADVSATDGAGS